MKYDIPIGPAPRIAALAFAVILDGSTA